jgi:hypothetical protein
MTTGAFGNVTRKAIGVTRQQKIKSLDFGNGNTSSVVARQQSHIKMA